MHLEVAYEADLAVHVQGRIRVKGSAAHHLPFEEGRDLAFHLLLQVTEGNPVELLQGSVRPVRVAFPVAPGEPAGLHDEPSAGNGPDKLEGLVRILLAHEDFDLAV